MPADGATPATPTAIEEPHQIHYTFTAPDAVTFDWRGNDRTLRFWAKAAAPRTIEAHPPVPAPPVPPAAAVTWQEAVLGGLQPGVEYIYEVGHPMRPQAMSFHAPLAPGSVGFRFVAVGDIGSSATSQAVARVHKMIARAEPTFVLGLGDLTYADEGSPADADRHFDDVMPWSRSAAYMPVWGNHEWEGKGDDLSNYKARFALPHAAASPGAPAAGCCGEDWYWFDQGAVRVIVYPEPYTQEAWADWARKAEPLFAGAEAAPAVRFVVTAGHRPAYSSGHHGGAPQLRAILDDFGKRFGKYVLNLAGHSHAYERTKPQSHVVHVTAGIGGGALEHAATNCLWTDCKQPGYIAFRAIHHGFVKLSVRADSIALEAICAGASPKEDNIRCADGEIMDQVTIPGGTSAAVLSARRGGERQQRGSAGGGDRSTDDEPIRKRPASH
ncbi:MAG TPA: metallophosphoesterase [Polyangia bacterium]